ncbi:MAG: hypothetical protein WCB11_23625 [Terriglobales bacterium]
MLAPLLSEFGYGGVTIASALHEGQLRATHDVLMNLSEDNAEAIPPDGWPTGAAKGRIKSLPYVAIDDKRDTTHLHVI